METERVQLRERREGKLRRALGMPLAGESAELLDAVGERDRLRAERGLVAVLGRGGISYKPLADLGRLDMDARTAAERVTVGWLRNRMESKRRGADPPPIPPHLG
ncbi:MAG TPA: hypothetical protein VFY54_13340 [Rubrobacter sp.]|nr:hypothetical protein [Rubrobacter sp.]